MSKYQPATKKTRLDVDSAKIFRTDTESQSVQMRDVITEVKTPESSSVVRSRRYPAAAQTSNLVPQEEMTDVAAGTSTVSSPKHPKGHKVRTLESVWKLMNAQDFLRLTDSYALGDVLVQPIEVLEPTAAPYVSVRFMELINAPNLKTREHVAKTSSDDLLKLLYLNDCIQASMRGEGELDYEVWYQTKTENFVARYGPAKLGDNGALCNFIIKDDPSFSFKPPMVKNVEIYFRKICYHSYTAPASVAKAHNPSVIKCISPNKKFEYVWEARMLPIPHAWSSPPPLATSYTVSKDGEVDRCPSPSPMCK